MSETWKPEDVAMVTIYGQEHIALRQWDRWINAYAENARDLGDVTSARRLVVIDPEDREQVERLREIASRLADDVPYSDTADAYTDAFAAALREFANPTPPIEEPTNLYAVVREVGGHEWCHIGGRVWRSLSSTGQFMVEKHWHDADTPLAGNVVEILSSGVPA